MNRNKEVNKHVLKAVKKITEVEVKRSGRRWPPYCTGFLHQPKRPEQK